MSYLLTYAFDHNPGQTLVPTYVSTSGVTGSAVTTTASFEISGHYGFTLAVADAYRGFIGFYNGGSLVVLFSVNPQEGENLDAKVSLYTGAIGPGGISVPVVIRSTSAQPIPDVSVWVTTDQAGTNVIAGRLYTDAFGTALFLLDHGSYWLWQKKTGTHFDNPQALVV